MTTRPETSLERCPRCGADLAEEARTGFCSRCAAAISLADTDAAEASEDELASMLPRTALASETRTRFGDYELLEEIARGGMGIVYRARQRSLNRIVAVKVLLFGGLTGAEGLRRFRTEAAAASSLEHPNIVRILDVGEHAGQPFLAMEYVAGRDLGRTASERPLLARQAAGYVEKIARAVEFAHQRGVLHRDLKSSNVLVDAFDEPRVTDFGLARNLADESELTRTGQAIGSPNFMPPEQAAGDLQRISAASDVYGLGAILYHLLTGRPPFLADTFEATLRQVLDREPIPPRQFNPNVPVDLETVCLKCLEKEPEKRYQTAQELAIELRRFLHDEPVRARPIGAVGKVWRWCRRKPVIASLVVALNVAFALGLAGVLWQWRRAESNARRAESNASDEARERRRAEAGESDARLRQYASDMNVVQQAWDDGNLKRAQGLLRSYIPKPGAPSDPRGFEWRYLWNLCQDESRYAFTNLEDGIGALAFAPDGKFLAVASGRVVKLLEVDSQNKLGELRIEDTNGWIRALAFSPRNTSLLATAGGAIRLWNLTTKEATNFAQLNTSWAFAFSPDGRTLAVADFTEGYRVSAWNIGENRLIWANKLDNPANALVFTLDGTALISGGGEGNGNAKVWDAATGKELAPFPRLHVGWVNDVTFSPDGRTLATSAADGQLIIWDFAERRVRGQPITHGGNSVAFSPDGRLIACIGVDLIARVWDVASRQLVALLRGPGPVSKLVFTPDGTRILCGGADHTVRVWDATGRPDKDTLKGHKSWVPQVAFSPNGRTLASVDFDLGVTKLWDVPTRRFITDLPSNLGAHYGGGAAFSPDGKLLATSTYRHTVMMWDTANLTKVWARTNDSGGSSLAFSPDGKVLGVAMGFLSMTPDPITCRLSFRDVASGEKLNRLTEAEPYAGAVSFSKDGGLVAVGYFGGSVRLWDWEKGTKVAEFQTDLDEVPTVAFSPGGDLLAAGGEGGEDIFLFRVAPPAALNTLEGHTGGVKCVAFAPDGKTLAVAGNDGTIRLWSVATHQLVLTLKKNGGIVTSIAFTRDGRFLASGGGDADVRLWPAPAFEELAGLK